MKICHLLLNLFIYHRQLALIGLQNQGCSALNTVGIRQIYLLLLSSISGNQKRFTFYEQKLIMPSWSPCGHMASECAAFRHFNKSLWRRLCSVGKDSPWTKRTLVVLSSFASLCSAQQNGSGSTAVMMIRVWLSFRLLLSVLLIVMFCQG